VARPSVSVVMSVRNGARFLPEAVESILGQSLADLEFVIVDDASTDDTPRLLERFSDPRVRVMRNDRRLGLATSLNRAMAEAQAEYIARMDADDISDPDRLARQVAFLEQHPGVGLLGTAAMEIDERGRILGLLERPVGAEEIRACAFERGNPFVHGSVVFRARLLQAVGGYDPRFPAAQDYDFFLRVLERFEADNLPQALYRLRRHPASLSATRVVQQAACAHLARKMSRARRAGVDPDRGEMAERLDMDFRRIRQGVFPPDLKAWAYREHARWLMDHRMGLRAVGAALRAVLATGPSRDNLWILRKAARSCLGMGPAGAQESES